MYYTANSQPIHEELYGLAASGGTPTAGVVTAQEFYGLRGTDDAVIRVADADRDGEFETSYHQLTDALFSVVTHVARDKSRRAYQRMTYSTYGRVLSHPLCDMDGDGRVGTSDDAIWSAFDPGLPTYYDDPRYDFNGDGSVDYYDGDEFAFQRGQTPRADEITIGYAGYVHSPSGYYLARNRWYDPGIGRWVNRDPAGYVDGLNTYLYVRCNPLSLVDPTGLDPQWFNKVTNWLADSDFGTRAIGLSKASGGAALAIGGIIMPPVAAYGLDLMQSGGNELVTGEPTPTITSKVLTNVYENSGMSPRDAQMASMSSEIVWNAALMPTLMGPVFEPPTGGSGGRGAAPVEPSPSGASPAEPAVPTKVSPTPTVLVDTNAVYQAKGLPAGEIPARPAITTLEMAANARSGKVNVPGAAKAIPEVPNGSNIDLRINVRGQMTPGKSGNFADGVIGGTALEQGLPLITSDKQLARAVKALGGNAYPPLPTPPKYVAAPEPAPPSESP